MFFFLFFFIMGSFKSSYNRANIQMSDLVPHEPSGILKSAFLPIPVLFTEKGCLTSKRRKGIKAASVKQKDA